MDSGLQKISFLASKADIAQDALQKLGALYGNASLDQAQVIVALGGDGFMLHTLSTCQHLNIPVYGMNCGTVGFLMNEFSLNNLHARLHAAIKEIINPLRMKAQSVDGTYHEELAINEVSLLRHGAQAAKLRIYVDGQLRLPELACDGALVCTPAGSTAYNYSAHGPILPIGSDVLALTAVAAFRPRRWRGALLHKKSVVRFEVLEPHKRPVMTEADSRAVGPILSVEVYSETAIQYQLLFDPGHGLEERLVREQFE